jgi:hypothetical protein
MRLLSRAIGLTIVAVSVFVAAGCSRTDVRNETVATVNGEGIKVEELRETLGVKGGLTAASDVPRDRKKGALDRLISAHLLAQEARAKGLDNTDEFRNLAEANREGILIAALFRKEAASKLNVAGDEVEAEAKKLRAADKTLSEEGANARAGRMVSAAKTRVFEENVVSAAKKAFPPNLEQLLLDKIGKREKVPENAVLGTAGGEKMTYGEVKKQLQQLSGGPHGAKNLFSNPVAVGRVLDRELTRKALVAYAKQQGVEGSEWIKSVRQAEEKMILFKLMGDQVAAQEAAVTDKEIRDAYDSHQEMFVRQGKKVSLAEVKEQLRGFLQSEKRKKALDAYVAELGKKAKITVDEKMLDKV